MRIFQTFAFALICATLLESGLAQTTDCVQLAKTLAPGGAFRITLADGRSKSFSSAKALYCSTDFLSYAEQSSASGGVTIPISGIPVSGSFDTKNSNQMAQRSSFCQDNSRRFSHQEETFILQKQGEPAILNTINQCIGQGQGVGALEVEAPPSHSETFDILVSTRSSLGEPPLIIDAQPIDNATNVSPFTPGERIPFNGGGSTPISATYRFQHAGAAKIKVWTTIGDKTVEALQCHAGNAGTWSLSEDVKHETHQDAGFLVRDFPIGQAGCHPHCKLGQGDVSFHDVSPPSADITLDNPSSQIIGQQGFDPNHAVMSNGVVHAYVMSRTVAVTLRVTAHQMKTVVSTTSDQVDSGSLQFGQRFFVAIDENSHGVLHLNTPIGNVTFSEAVIQAGDLPNWVVSKGSPTPSGTKMIYQLEIADAGCEQ